MMSPGEPLTSPEGIVVFFTAGDPEVIPRLVLGFTSMADDNNDVQ